MVAVCLLLVICWLSCGVDAFRTNLPSKSMSSQLSGKMRNLAYAVSMTAEGHPPKGSEGPKVPERTWRWPQLQDVKQGSKFVAVAAVAAMLSLQDASSAIAAASRGSLPSLESAVRKLETSETRGDAVQSLADLYEVTQTKTLLARTKFKYRIVEAINAKHVQLSSVWDDALNYEARELKRTVDPFRTVDLSGYLKIAPYVGGALYLVVLLVQQTLPELFSFAYPGAVFVFTAPILYIIFTL